jgi:stage V sporulation protein B
VLYNELDSLVEGVEPVRSQSFLRGAFVLAVAGIVSKVLGALYRFALPYFLSDDGLGLYQMAYPIYTTLLSLSAMGIPIAISKLVSEKLAKGDGRNARRVFRIAFMMLALVGFAFTVVLIVAAPAFAEFVLKEPRAVTTITAIAPAIFFVSVMAAYRGLFQGFQQMEFHAVSQVVEQIVRVGTIFLLVIVLIPYGTRWQAAGANFGAVTGGIAGLLYLVYSYMRRRSEINSKFADTGGKVREEGTLEVVYRILRLAVPVSLAGVMLPLVSFLDSIVVPSRLHVAGFGEESTALYGILTAKAMPFINAPTVITAALALSLVPAISEALASDNEALVRHRARAGIRVTFLLNMPAAAGLFLLSRQVPDMLWNAPEVGGPLSILTAGMLFLTVQQATSGVLQGLGRPELPVRNLFAGAMVKIAVTWYLTALPAWNINGAAVGTVLGFLTAAALNLTEVQLKIGKVLDVFDMLLRPAAAVLIMGVAVRVGYDTLLSMTGSNAVSTLATVGLGVVVYGIAIILVGGLRKNDLDLIPLLGPWLARLFQRIGVLDD